MRGIIIVNKVEIKNLYKKFDTFTLDGLSFSVLKGFITGFIGRNGTGKTTTIKSILSLINYDKGEILYDGEKIKNREYLQDVGVVMDEPFLSLDWNMNYVNEAMKVGYDRWNSEIFYNYLSRFGINKKLKVRELSRGMKIKLMLAIALSHEAKVLILDEPTSGLDPSMRDELTDILKEFVEDEENTILFSTHITQDLEAIADYIVFIDDGKLINFCSKDDFLNKYIILKGALEDLNKIDDKYIIGRKVNAFGFEILIDRVELSNIEIETIEEIPTIDKILILYGVSK